MFSASKVLKEIIQCTVKKYKQIYTLEFRHFFYTYFESRRCDKLKKKINK